MVRATASTSNSANKSIQNTKNMSKTSSPVINNPKKTGPSASTVTKTKNVNEITGLAPFDLESVEINESGEAWLVQGKRKKAALATIEEEPQDLMQVTREDIQEELNFWKPSVYCFILGANPPLDVVEGFIRRIWMNYPIDKVSFLPSGIFLVRFQSVQSKDAVLRQGHFLFDNKPLIVRNWTENVELTKDDVKAVPVWFKLMNLPLKFWGKCLPKIAGLLGKYIRSDVSTMEKTRLGFARVLLEVPFGQKLPTFVKFLDEDGNIVKIVVECEWQPISCFVCGGIGHESEKCRKPKPKSTEKPVQQQWIPKKTTAPVVTVNPPSVIVPTTQPAKPVSPVIILPVTPAGTKTPEEVQHKLQVTWSKDGTYSQVQTPAKPPITMSRQEIIRAGKTNTHLSQYTFQDALNNATPKPGIGTALTGNTNRVGIGTIGSVLLPPGIRTNVCDGWSVSTNTSCHTGGRVWVLWNPSIFHVHFVHYSAQLIHMEVTEISTKFHFYCSMIYAFNDTAGRRSLWHDLNLLSSGVHIPWILCRDFNCVLSPSERLGGQTSEEEMVEFQACIDHCQLVDSPAVGSFYTWNNKQDPQTRVYSRLDRVLVNSEWLQWRPSSHAHFYNEGLFDHTPRIIRMLPIDHREKKF
ncbi:uncharacterized protein LOC141627591 [Silene latifolia]|uniref:uncharacterized protein LOC141627591 n=1 Tax=Silene latifolia TaxID=37657 RepID=UPI003D77B56F